MKRRDPLTTPGLSVLPVGAVKHRMPKQLSRVLSARSQERRLAARFTRPEHSKPVTDRRSTRLAIRAGEIPALFVLVIVLLGALSAWAADDLAERFDSANRLYAAGHFSEAAMAYQTLILSEGVSPALFFNLGNAHFKSGEMGRAIAAFRRAAALAPRDPDVRANLQFARAQVQGPTLRSSFYERWLLNLSLSEWTWLAVLAFWTTIGLLIARQLRPQLTERLRQWTWLAGGITALLGVTLIAQLRGSPAAEVAIVVAEDASVRTSPFEESPASFAANDGAEFRVQDRKDEWLQVTDGGRRLGWLKATNVVLVPGRG